MKTATVTYTDGRTLPRDPITFGEWRQLTTAAPRAAVRRAIEIDLTAVSDRTDWADWARSDERGRVQGAPSARRLGWL